MLHGPFDVVKYDLDSHGSLRQTYRSENWSSISMAVKTARDLAGGNPLSQRTRVIDWYGNIVWDSAHTHS